MPLIREILDWFELTGHRVHRNQVDLEQVISGPRALQEAGSEHLAFIGDKMTKDYPKILESVSCRIVILDEGVFQTGKITDLPPTIAFILSKNPKADTIHFCKQFLSFEQPNLNSSIHPSANIGENVVIGENTIIQANVVLENNVTIGSGCTIGVNTVVHGDTQIGNDVRIGACNVIGGVGFGYSRINSDEYEQFPHYGKVIIGDRVNIGNNTCIDRGSLSDTVIGNAVKIDNLVHIAHNVKIGENTLIIANCMIAGSATIGKNSWIAPSSSVRNGIKIGDNVTVGMGSVVTKNVDDHQIVAGNPAMLMKDFNALRKAQKQLLKDTDLDN